MGEDAERNLEEFKIETEQTKECRFVYLGETVTN